MKKSLSLFILSGILVLAIAFMSGLNAKASTIIDVTESTTENTVASSGITSGSSANTYSSSSENGSGNSESNSGASSGNSQGTSSSSYTDGGSSDGEVYIDDNGKLQVTSSVSTEGLFTRIQNKLIEAFTGARGIALVIICIIFICDAVALAFSVFGGGKRMGAFIAGLLVCLVAFVLVMYAPEISVAFSNWIITD